MMTDLPPKQAASIHHDIDRDAFVFTVKDVEVLSLARDGEARVYGRPCGNDTELFEAARRFFTAVTDWLAERQH